MKHYLKVTAILFLLTGIAHTSRIFLGGEIKIMDIAFPETGSWVVAFVGYSLFVLAIALHIHSTKKENQTAHREKELSDLIEIVKANQNSENLIKEIKSEIKEVKEMTLGLVAESYDQMSEPSES